MLSKKNKIIFGSIIALIYMLFSIYFLTPIVMAMNSFSGYKGIGTLPNGTLINTLLSNPVKSYQYFFTHHNLLGGVIKSFFVISALLALVIVTVKRNFKVNGNITYLEDNGVHGTANWMHEDEAKTILNVGSNVKGLLYGTLANKNVALQFDTYKYNKNAAIFGAPGTGKSRSYSRPNICQLAFLKQSMIITDPKGELFRDCYLFLKNRNYNVKVFNLVNMINSDRWNPLTEVTDDLSAQLFTEVVISNTKAPGTKANQFWENCEKNLLKSLVLYVAYELPKLERNMKNLYNILAGKDTKTIDEMFECLPNGHPAKNPYNLYSQSGDDIRSGIVIGLGTRLQVFQNKIVQSLTEKSDIDLTEPGKSPCAYFIITSDMNSTFDFLSGLFFSFLFNNLVTYADLHDGKCSPEVFCILDEFPNIASIPDFQKKLSTMRSRGIHCNIIFQNLAQLQNRYPDNGWSEILGNCDSKLFLGCTDLLTAQYVSELLGVTTVEDTATSKSAGIERLLDFGKVTKFPSERNLMNPDEILKFPNDKAMLFVKGQKPLILDKQSFEKHPLAKEFKPIQISYYKPEWAKNIEFNYKPQKTNSKQKNE